MRVLFVCRARVQKTGIKCTLESGGNINGKPTKSTVTSYSWVYVW